MNDLVGRGFYRSVHFSPCSARTREKIPTTKPVQSTSMKYHVFTVLLMSAIGVVSAKADPMSLNRTAQANARPSTPAYVAPQAAPAPVAAERTPDVRYAAANPGVNLGGRFLEVLVRRGRLVETSRP